MVLACDLWDVPVFIVGGKRPPPPDATADFLAKTVCTLCEPFDIVPWVELPFAEGETALVQVPMQDLEPG